MDVVTSESQVTTENTKPKAAPKIPLSSGRTPAAAPRRADPEASLSLSLPASNWNCPAAQIVKNKNLNRLSWKLQMFLPNLPLSSRHSFRNKEVTRWSMAVGGGRAPSTYSQALFLGYRRNLGKKSQKVPINHAAALPPREFIQGRVQVGTD